MSSPKPPKPSAIPRPQTTPTKTNSYMTAYGFRSPKEPGSPTPPRRSPPLVHTSSVGTTRSASEELQALKQTAEERDGVLKELGASNLTLRTQIQRLEEAYAELEERVLALTQALRIKVDSLRSVEEDRVARVEELQRGLALKKAELDSGNAEALNNKEKAYQTQMTAVLQQKRGELDERRNLLQQELSQLKDELSNNEAIVRANIERLGKESADKEKGLLKLMLDTKDTVLKETKELEAQKSKMESQIEDLKKQYLELQSLKDTETTRLKVLETDNSHLASETSSLQSKLEQLQRLLSTKKESIGQLKQEMQWKIETKIQLDQDRIHEEEQRRKLHNRLQELKGNIRVFCRIRPKIPSEAKEDLLQIQVPDNDEVKQDIDVIYSRVSSSSGPQQQSASTNKKYNFKFDRVFQQDTTNPEIFEEISQLVQSALYGFNICIFAYGQTGSGKTFTMSNEDGVIPQSIRQIFESCHKQAKRDWDYTISGEFLEIHNETIKDLLSDQSGNTLGDSKKYEIKHDQLNKSTYITNLTKIEFSSPREMTQTLQKALNNRSIASTKSNEHSSRSHTVCIIRLTGTNNKSGECVNSVINLIDLAGSERITQSGVSGDRLKETQAINKSLSCLGDVIYALGNDNSKHIPFRNSKLTYLLQYSLIEDSKTLMFVNVSPLAKNLNETVNSLRFATKVNNTGLQRKV